MATKIRLMRLGKIRVPQYRIVVTDSRTKRDGRFIEAVGKYHPKEDPSFIQVDSERVQYWLSVGAQPTEPVAAILKVTGDWQRFRGEPGESTLRTRAERPDRRRVFEEAAREGVGGDAGAAAPAPKARKSAPAEPTATAEPAAEPVPAEPAAAEPVAEGQAGVVTEATTATEQAAAGEAGVGEAGEDAG